MSRHGKKKEITLINGIFRKSRQSADTVSFQRLYLLNRLSVDASTTLHGTVRASALSLSAMERKSRLLPMPCSKIWLPRSTFHSDGS